MKLIREGRFGLPKSAKTVAVVGTYPKPMLVFCFDEEGLSVIPRRDTVIPPDLIQPDIRYEDVVWCNPEEIGKYLDHTPADQLPKVVAMNFYDATLRQVDLQFQAAANSMPMSRLMNALNLVVTGDGGRTRRDPNPFRTIVLDSTTGMTDIILGLIAQINPNSLKDGRLWAPLVGSKVQQIVGVVCGIQSHVVFIAHSQLDKNELVGSIIELPAIYSSYREKIGAYLSQFLYATKQNGKPVVWTSDQMFVRGIGCRWPVGLPPVCGPTFKDIYGKELPS